MKITKRDLVMLLFLAVLLIGVLYYMLFFTPMQNDMAQISQQITDTDSQIQVSLAKAQKMKAMQDELDEILSRPADQITEIAPYDNAKVVMNELNTILSVTDEYNLKFENPKINDDGTVRRVVKMEFKCPNFASAKQIIKELSTNHWRCLMNTVAVKAIEYEPVEGEEGEVEFLPTDAIYGPVEISATITFFENTKIS